MNPNYRLFIDTCIEDGTDNPTWMRLVKCIPFVPLEGMVIRVRSETQGEEESEELDIALVNVVYDAESGMFIESQADSTAEQASIVSDSAVCKVRGQLIESYARFGFVRLNYGTVTAR